MPKSLFPHGSAHVVGGYDLTYQDRGNWSATRIDTLERTITLAAQAITSGTIYLSYITPAINLTVTKMLVANVVAASGNALSRVGIYSVDGTGICTLVAASADLHALTDATNASATYFSQTNKIWSCPLTLAGDLSTSQTSYALVRGTRYAFASIYVTGTMPTIFGIGNAALLAALAPQTAGAFAAQADLVTPISAAHAAGNATHLLGMAAA